MVDPAGFVGAKIALFLDDQILTYLRDDHAGLPWAAHWDLPGGGREGDESGVDCLFREVEEEFGLRLGLSHLTWRCVLPAMLSPGKPSLFFAGRITAQEAATIRFGDEGQEWRFMPLAEWLLHAKAVPEMQRRTQLAIDALAASTICPFFAAPSGLGAP
jgi:8-oxo-dGTP diphosphatase